MDSAYNNVWAITMLLLLYIVCIDPSESIWYALEQYGEKTDRNLGMSFGHEPPAVMHS